MGFLWLRLVSLAGLCLTLLGGAAADEETHEFEEGDDVTLWINKIGPYHNPQETYTYYHLPFCKPAVDLQPATKWAGMGETLEGNELINSGLAITYGVNTAVTPVCSLKLDKESAGVFAVAVSNHYWYQMYLDDLPIWGMLGEVVALEEVAERIEALERENKPHENYDQTYLYTHRKISIAHNERRIIEVNLTSENPKLVREGDQLDFTYSVEWTHTNTPFQNRFDRYLDYSFFEHQIHWFSIFNSFMMVIFLCGLVSLIMMRTLRNDYAKYMRDDDELEALDQGQDDSGWKQVHGDVFRRPDHLSLFCALYGTGCQLILLVLSVIFLSIVRTLYIDRGATISAGIVCYALTSIVSGYQSGSTYLSYHAPGEPTPDWMRTMVLTATLFPGVVFTVIFLLNFVAMYYKTMNAIPIGTMISVLLIWILVSLPLTVAGTILGRHWSKGGGNWPCRTNRLPRPIPEKEWYLKPALIVLLTGVLPFGSIFIEMYFVFTSFWNYKFYYVYGFMLLVFVILMAVTVCVTIVSTYFLLNAEDWRWHWMSMFSAGSTSIYVFLYAVYYFLMKTNMTGFLQTAFYFGYMLLFCIGIGLMTSAMGVLGASVFVQRIYRNIKVD